MDILFTASMYKSAQNALRMARSLSYVDGNHLCVFTTPLMSDIDDFMRGDDNWENVVVLHSEIDNLYFCRAAGFLYALSHGLNFKYYCSCDDDIEFTVHSAPLLSILDKFDFSLMTFKRIGLQSDEELLVYSPAWINGDSMFSRFEDNLKYGLPDSLPNESVTYFTEVEYQHRMRFLTGRPMIVDKSRKYYVHHFRPQGCKITALRSASAMQWVRAGNRFWAEKYGLKVNFVRDGSHESVYAKTMKTSNLDKIKQHLIFDGLWNDWYAIQAKFRDSWTEVRKWG